MPAQKEPVEVLLEDYPALRRDDVEFAKMYVALGRPPGRPRKLRLVRSEGNEGHVRPAGRSKG